MRYISAWPHRSHSTLSSLGTLSCLGDDADGEDARELSKCRFVGGVGRVESDMAAIIAE